MAVLGGKQYNNDPLKIPKWQVYRQDLEFFYHPSNSFANLTMQDSDTWGTGSPFNALVSTNSVADTARTIVNLSNKKGWLTFGVGPCGINQTATWVITVDGVATTFTVGGSGPVEYDLSASGFGLIFSNLNFSAFLQGHFQLGGDTSTSPWYAADNAISYGLENAGGTANSRFILDPMWLKSGYPDSCVRFETSLTVTVESDVAATGVAGNAGIMYVLDE